MNQKNISEIRVQFGNALKGKGELSLENVVRGLVFLKNIAGVVEDVSDVIEVVRKCLSPAPKEEKIKQLLRFGLGQLPSLWDASSSEDIDNVISAVKWAIDKFKVFNIDDIMQWLSPVEDKVESTKPNVYPANLKTDPAYAWMMRQYVRGESGFRRV